LSDSRRKKPDGTRQRWRRCTFQGINRAAAFD
jgi:hypothetical protein